MKRLKKIVSMTSLTLLASFAFAQNGNQPVAAQLQQIRALQQQQATGRAQAKTSPQTAAAQKQSSLSNFLDGLNNSDESLLSEFKSPSQKVVNSQQQSVNEEAFDKMANGLLPLTPTQIRRLRQMFSASKAAAAALPGTPPRPVATSQFVHLAPGSTPPVIRLAQGFVTSLMFLDSTGAPWPIAAYDIGDPQSFNIQWNKKDNMLMIQAMRQYVFGNMAIRLRGLSTPVMLTLIPGQKAVDYRVDMRVEGIGPQAKYLPSGDGLPAKANNELLHVLDGNAPTGGVLLQVYGGTAKAWAVGDRLFLRTRYTVLSPSWLATLSSADGMNAYEMNRSPLILASAHGKVIKPQSERVLIHEHESKKH